MIDIYLQIRNPFSNRFDSGHSWTGKLTKHKAWEIRVMKTADIVSVNLGFTVRQDHAGIRIELGLFGNNVCFTVYDTRHWDHTTNQWCVYE